MSDRTTFPYPMINEFDSGKLPLDGLHTMYWEQSGNPNGVPILYLHGGPGGVINDGKYRRLFDTDFYRLIFFHQRGSGWSTPSCELRENTTHHLIRDIEQLRRHLNVDRWIVSGGSWGSTLALAYAEEHPKSCIGLLLRGVFLGRESDLDWFFFASQCVYPEIWEKFIEFLPPNERIDYKKFYFKRILDPDPEIHVPAIKSFAGYELSMVRLIPDPEDFALSGNLEFAMPYARMNAHYISNFFFLKEKPILAHIDKIQHMPGTVVHGRYDMSVPLAQAVELTRAWPRSKLVCVPDGGHSALDGAIANAWIAAQSEAKSWSGRA